MMLQTLFKITCFTWLVWLWSLLPFRCNLLWSLMKVHFDCYYESTTWQLECNTLKRIPDNFEHRVYALFWPKLWMSHARLIPKIQIRSRIQVYAFPVAPRTDTRHSPSGHAPSRAAIRRPRAGHAPPSPASVFAVSRRPLYGLLCCRIMQSWFDLWRF